MKALSLLVIVFIFAGCTYEGRDIGSYLEQPSSLIKDPHFAEYQKQRDEIEKAYLAKEITYAEYLERTEKLDEIYAKEVSERDAIIAE